MSPSPFTSWPRLTPAGGHRTPAWIVLLGAVLVAGPVLADTDTAFTYQGLLRLAGSNVSDLCDFEFRLFDDPNSGTQVGPTVIFDGVTGDPAIMVVDGLFSVVLDFGPGAFDGTPRYLEVAVRCPSGVGEYTTLDPRQPVTASPQAIHAQQSEMAAGVTAPLFLSLDDPNVPTLSVENLTPDGVALDVQGDLRVGQADAFRVDAFGGMAAQSALIAGDVNLSGFLTVGTDPQVASFVVFPADGSLSAGVAPGSDPKFYVNVAEDAVASTANFFVSDVVSELKFRVTASSGDTFVKSRIDLGDQLLPTISLDGETGDVELDGILDVEGDAFVDGTLRAYNDAAIGSDALNDTVRLAARLELSPTELSEPPTAFINGGDGSAFLGGSLELEGAFIDSANNSPGTANQFLSSTGSGTEWRDLIIEPLDMQSFAITNIGSNGSSFTGEGGLDLRGNLSVGPADNFFVSGTDGGLSIIDPTLGFAFTVQPSTGNTFARGSLEAAAEGGTSRFLVESDGHLKIGPDVFNDVVSFSVDASSGIFYSTLEGGVQRLHFDPLFGLSIGPDAFNESPTFFVGITGNTRVGGDLELDGALIDAGDSPGDPGDILSSTGTGTQWIDRRAFVDGIVVPDDTDPKFSVTAGGTTDIRSTLTVEPDDGGAPGPDQNSITARATSGSAVFADGKASANGLFVNTEQGRAIVANSDAADFAMQLHNNSGDLITWQAPAGKIGDMLCISDEAGLTVTNSGTGAALDVKSGDLLVSDESIHVKKSYFDSGDSPGTDGQVLTSTGVGTQWRDLINQTLDLRNFAITNIGTNGSSFSAEGALLLNADLFVEAQDGPSVVQVDRTNAQFIVGENKVVVDAATGDVNVGGGLFTVNGSNGNVATQRDLTVAGDAHVNGAYFDSSGVSGNEGQLLSSTIGGTLWVDPPGQGGDGDFNSISVANAAEFGPDADPTARIDGVTGEGIFEGPVEPQGGIRDEAGSLGTVGQVLTSTAAGVLWQDCDCDGGGNGTSCITCDGGDATLDPGTMTIVNTDPDKQALQVANSFPDDTTRAAIEVFNEGAGVFNAAVRAVTFGAGPALCGQGSGDGPGGDFFSFSTNSAGVEVTNPVGNAINASGDTEFTGDHQQNGDINATGAVNGAVKNFMIDHPLDPENRFLVHTSVESPDMMNIYNGNAITDADGYADVVLPEWFEALNSDYRYQLTVIGDFAQAIVAEEVRDGAFVIRTDRPNVKVSWQVTGIRQDPYALANRSPVEVWKSDVQRGRYLHAAAWGVPQALSLDRAARVRAVEATKRAETVRAMAKPSDIRR